MSGDFDRIDCLVDEPNQSLAERHLVYGVRVGTEPVRGPWTEADCRYWLEILTQITASARLMVSADGGRTWTEADR